MGNQTSKSGSFIQTVPSAPEKATAEGKWITTFQGTKWVTPDVISGPEINKEPYMMGAEKWGYYKKNIQNLFLVERNLLYQTLWMAMNYSVNVDI